MPSRTCSLVCCNFSEAFQPRELAIRIGFTAGARISRGQAEVGDGAVRIELDGGFERRNRVGCAVVGQQGAAQADEGVLRIRRPVWLRGRNDRWPPRLCHPGGQVRRARIPRRRCAGRSSILLPIPFAPQPQVERRHRLRLSQPRAAARTAAGGRCDSECPAPADRASAPRDIPPSASLHLPCVSMDSALSSCTW